MVKMLSFQRKSKVKRLSMEGKTNKTNSPWRDCLFDQAVPSQATGLSSPKNIFLELMIGLDNGDNNISIWNLEIS